MKRKHFICVLTLLLIIAAGVLLLRTSRQEPMYFHREGLYEISSEGTVTLLTDQPVSMAYNGVLYSLVETEMSWSMTRNGETYLEEMFYYPEDDPAHRAEFSPCGYRNQLCYADYGGNTKLFYPFLLLADDMIHLAYMDDDEDVFGYLDFAVDNSFLRACDDKIYFLLDLEDGRYPARLDWDNTGEETAVQLSEISANTGGQIWLAQEQFWWIHHEQEDNTASLCRVPLSGGETTVTEMPEGYFLDYISEDHVYYHEDGILKVFSFKTNKTASYPELSESVQICTAADWGALLTENGETFCLLYHKDGRIIDLGGLAAKEDET